MRALRRVGGVTGAAQQVLHVARPIFLFDVDQGFELAQMMGVAQGMKHVRHRVVGFPVIMHDDTDDLRQQAAASGADAIEGQPGGGSDMQPLGLAANAKAGLIHVLDRRASDEVAHRGDEILPARGASPAHPGDGRGGQLDAEQIGHQLGQTILGQQFSVTRERIRQIEAKALRKLKHPSRSRALRSFIDN